MPLIISIAEDATRILSNIQYDPTNNQIVGFVSPLGKNGEPIKLIFPATSAELIVKYFDNYEKANNAIVVMAQPVQQGEFFLYTM